MALRTIQINGFKSFAGDTTLHFFHPVTAIVGPNGSGKSNVADAIRFALGEQSMKSLRGGKGEDLIFNGSSKVARKNRAQVSLLFNNKDNIFDLDSSEVELQRLVHRDGVNEYIVNSNKTRLKDKLELIASANIGPTGHHLITQGEADKFVTATDVERRLLIEDALGLNLYKLRRREAENKLDKTTDKLKEVSKHIWELEPVVKSLSGEVERLQNLKNKESTLTTLYADMFYLWRKWITQQSLEYETKLADLAKFQQKLEAEIKKYESQASEKEDLTDDEINLGIKTKKVKQGLADKRESLNTLSIDLGEIKGQLTQLLNRQQRLEKLVASTNDNLNVSTIAVSADRVARLHHEIQSAASLMAAKQSDDKFYNECFGDSESQSSESKDNYQTELSQINSQIQELTRRQNEKQIKERSIQNEIKELEQFLARLEQDSRVASRDRLDSVRALEKARAELKLVNSKIEETIENQGQLNEDEKHFKDRKHKIASIYGAEAIDQPAISIPAGERIDTRLRETKRQVLRLEAQLEDADITSLGNLRRDLEVEAARLSHLQTERHDVDQSLQKTKQLVGNLTAQIETKIEVGLAQINVNLERFFRVLFGGGTCILRSTNENNKPGVSIDLKLPFKRIKSVNSLSGGERSLASLAILFAITLLSPPPFVVLDETDAALDEANSRRYAKLIRELSDHTQLILITHNRETMTFADELYGVTMGSDGVSRLLSVTLKQGETIVEN
jgi:chromosome segregation protein